MTVRRAVKHAPRVVSGSDSSICGIKAKPDLLFSFAPWFIVAYVQMSLHVLFSNGFTGVQYLRAVISGDEWKMCFHLL